MIIFLAGYPFSGKSSFAHKLIEALPGRKIIHIDPKKLLPNEYDSLSQEDQRNAMISAWEVANETLTNSMSEPDDTIIIFDTCASKITNMLQHFINARANKHAIVCCFVAATLDECKQRAGNKWPSQDVINNYAANFTDSLPKFKRASDKFFFLKNSTDETMAGLKNAAERIAKVLTNGKTSRILQSKPIFSTFNRSRQKTNRRPTV